MEVKEIMTALGVTNLSEEQISKVLEICGISPETAGKWVADETKLTPETLEQTMEIFGYRLECGDTGYRFLFSRRGKEKQFYIHGSSLRYLLQAIDRWEQED